MLIFFDVWYFWVTQMFLNYSTIMVDRINVIAICSNSMRNQIKIKIKTDWCYGYATILPLKCVCMCLYTGSFQQPCCACTRGIAKLFDSRPKMITMPNLLYIGIYNILVLYVSIAGCVPRQTKSAERRTSKTQGMAHMHSTYIRKAKCDSRGLNKDILLSITYYYVMFIMWPWHFLLHAGSQIQVDAARNCRCGCHFLRLNIKMVGGWARAKDSRWGIGKGPQMKKGTLNGM